MVTLTCEFPFDEESTDLANMSEYQEARLAAEHTSVCVVCSQLQVDAYMYTSWLCVGTHNCSKLLDSFADIIDLAMKGDPSKVDMMVSRSLDNEGLVSFRLLIDWDYGDFIGRRYIWKK